MTALGYDLSAYDRYVYAFSTSACSWWGMGNVGGPRAYINGSYAVRPVAHELGHNFGNRHSHRLQCDSTGCVTFASQPCTTATPTVSLSPSAAQWSPSGSIRDYTVTVTNHASVGCSASPFGLSAASTLPSGWAAAFDASRLNIAPGASASTVAHVTSAASTPGGLYSITFSAVDGNATYTRSAPVSAWVAPKLDVIVVASQSTAKGGSSIAMSATVTIAQSGVPGAPG